MKNDLQVIKDWLGTGSINIFGRPLCGKDTQGRILADSLGSELIAGGDILRNYPNQDKINQLMTSGELFPTDLYLEIVLPYLSRDELKNSSLVLSSVGRLEGEEQTIMQATKESGHPTKAVVYINLPEHVVWQRLSETQSQHDRGNRLDDNEAALRVRLDKFNTQTMPVVDYYSSLGLVVEVDGSLDREAVSQQIVEKLRDFALSQS